MAAAWDIADGTLSNMLTLWKLDTAEQTDYVMHLYQNDYTPIPGSDLTDYEECDFNGYVEEPVNNTTWGSVVVASHVASTTNSTACVFVGGEDGFLSQNIYGYYITDSEGVYLWGERFAVTKVMEPLGTLSVVPKMRQKTAPAS